MGVGAGGKGITPHGGKPGDWSCPACGNLVYASKSACGKCNTPKPVGGIDAMVNLIGGAGGKGPTPPGGKPGDWLCPNCGNLVYASKIECGKCGTPKPSVAEQMSTFGG